MLKPRSIFIYIFYLLHITLPGQINFDSLIRSSKILNKVACNPKKYHLQIIYTRIEVRNGEKIFKQFVFPADSSNYSYCASLVKLPVAVLALRKLNALNISPKVIMFTDSTEPCHRKIEADSTSLSGYPSVEHYLRRMLLVSDNEAYNRCFEFLGTEYIHNELSSLGYPSVNIVTRYDNRCPPANSRSTNPVTFCNQDLKPIYKQDQAAIENHWKQPTLKLQVGKGYKDANNRYIQRPKDFSYMNYMTLMDCHRFLKDLLYAGEEKFGLQPEQIDFLIQQMSLLPRQSVSPRYNSKVFPDNYKKYLYYGDFKESIQDTNLVITNIVGQSYGFLSDCARITDQANRIEFLLSATLYVNEDEIINDGKYEYATIGLPFLGELGRKIYDYEIKAGKK